jgi:predicted Abi (CAAX) family protease
VHELRVGGETRGTPHELAMATDPNVAGRYRLVKRPLRDTAGVAFTINQVFYRASPWPADRHLARHANRSGPLSD